MEPVDQPYDSPAVEPSAADYCPTASPWGFWWTLIFGFLIAVVYLIVLLMPAGFFVARRYPQASLQAAGQLLAVVAAEGFYIALASLATAIVCGGLVLLLVTLRRGITVSDYLGLKPVSGAQLLKWLGVAIIFWAACDASSLLLKRDVVPDFMIKAYSTAGSLPLFWLGIVVAAPVLEELFFRGFLFAGWSRSRLGPIGTILLTAVLWALLHQQYGAYEITMIGLMGFILGFARLKTGSLYTPLLMHCLQNLIATTEIGIFVGNSL